MRSLSILPSTRFPEPISSYTRSFATEQDNPRDPVQSRLLCRSDLGEASGHLRGTKFNLDNGDLHAWYSPPGGLARTKLVNDRLETKG